MGAFMVSYIYERVNDMRVFKNMWLLIVRRCILAGSENKLQFFLSEDSEMTDELDLKGGVGACVCMYACMCVCLYVCMCV
jgi:hypothetical protein